jgi:hypothetical protein
MLICRAPLNTRFEGEYSDLKVRIEPLDQENGRTGNIPEL